MTLFHAYVFGTPRPQPRPRFVRGKVISVVSPRVKLWRDRLRQVFSQARGPTITTAVKIDMTFSFKGPAKRWGKPHAIRPDKDNLEKLALDVLKKAGVLTDDCLVCGGETLKVWARAGGLEVKITPASPVQDDGDLGALVID